METLFEPPEPGDEEGAGAQGATGGDAPLAARLRPRTLADFVGQEHLLAPGSALRAAVEQGRAHSMILYGPPGSGKTTLARLVAEQARAAFEEHSAVQAGRAEVRAVLERARHRRAASGEPTIFFLDEIHRFNKAQQDALLPAVEDGLVTLIGATTENPYFEVNAALLSRTRIYELHALDAGEVASILARAAPEAPVEVLEFLAARSGGDARTALSALELAGENASHGEPAGITMDHAQDALQRRALRYDRAGHQHYDYISAWIKATRGSDPDASLYYLAVMLEGGEDPRFIVRRMLILASEDVGNADPQAIQLTAATAAAVEHAGMPECQFALAQAAIYLILAPKSDAAKRAIGRARAHVREHGAAPPPDHLRSSAYPGAAKLGRGAGYDDPHQRPGHVSPQELSPAAVAGERFYLPDAGEASLAARLAEIARARGRDLADGGGEGRR